MPPANDDFANALAISGSGSDTSSAIDDATTEAGEPTGNALSSDDGDILRFNIDSASTVTRATLLLALVV